MTPRALLSTLFALVAAPALPEAAADQAAEAAESPSVSLTFAGEAGTAFTASCEIDEAGGTRAVVIEGPAPKTARFDAHGLACRIESEGRLTVEIEGPRGNRSRMATSGGVISVTAR